MNNILPSVGKFVGTLIGKNLKKKLLQRKYYTSHESGKLEKIKVQTVKYGKEIPIIYGNVKLSGNIIWSSGLKELKNAITKTYYHLHDSHQHSYTEYKYKISLAIALCEGKIDNVLRMWINNCLVDLSHYNIKVYKGEENQLPDPLIEKNEGKGKVPGYRGLAYIVIEDFPISNFHNKIPNFTFEVKKNNIFQNNNNLENLIDAVAIIPGSGEFVYDTQIQKKTFIRNQLTEPEEVVINAHTELGESDAIISLNQLQETLPNVKWVSLIVNWFATDLDAKKCCIFPGVEFKDENTTTHPDSWKVANYQRHNAHSITQVGKVPIYGGTVNDKSVLRYIKMLKNRGYKVMFYPMLLVDNHTKPWRGKIFANNSQDINHFFDNIHGYKNFITHYANLVKENIDAFIIGSELVTLTKFKTLNNDFPAVDKLIELANDVRKILSKNVKISYAADWSEYHHTEGGWYNLDKLWASSDIDFVGIDAYFPLTDNNKTTVDYKEVMDCWDSGEGYEYYLDHEQKKHQLSQEYAWKNIKWWWENTHINPDGKKTQWQPKLKNIWFTEVGFPSTDCATNQPNVFFDPYSTESAIPKYSKGKIDFYAQRVGLLATQMKWKNSPMVENKFIWAWDARPYPYWPDRNDVWHDSVCWAKGHWIQGKLGQSNLKDILTDLCIKSGMKKSQFSVSKINQHVAGFYILHHNKAKRIIEDLKRLYFFDVVESGKAIHFLPKENKETHYINYHDLLVTENNKNSLIIQNISHYEIISKVSLNYIKRENTFLITTAYAQSNVVDSKNCSNLSVPIIFQEAEAKNIANEILKSATSEKVIYTFLLHIKYILLKPGDLIELKHNKQKYSIKIISIIVIGLSHIEVSGVSNS